MLIPQLGREKDLDLCKYILMTFLERLFTFQNEVKNSPPLIVTGIESDIKKLQDVVIKMMDKLEKMKGTVKETFQ